MKTKDEIKKIIFEELAKQHEYASVEEFIEEYAYSNDDEWRSGLDKFMVDVQCTGFYLELRGNTNNKIFSDYSTDGEGNIKWFVDIHGNKEMHWLFKKNNYGYPVEYVTMILPYLYQMQVNDEVELTGIELYELLNNTAVIYDGIMVYVGWLNEPSKPGDVICVLENDGDRIEIVDGDLAVLKNGVISVKNIELLPLNVGKFELPRR